MASDQGHLTDEDKAIVRVIGLDVSEKVIPRAICFSQRQLDAGRKAHDASDSPILPPINDLGSLTKFPNELLTEVLRYLDIETFLGFILTNRQAYTFATDMTEYRTATTHGLPALMGILAGGVERWFSFTDIYRSMLQWRCEACGRPGDYLYLLTATRACHRCLFRNPRFRPVAISAFSKAVGMGNQRLKKKLPVFHQLPWATDSTDSRGLSLIDFTEALKVAQSCGANKAVLVNSLPRREGAHVSVRLPFFNRQTQQSFQSRSCLACLLRPRGRYPLVPDDEVTKRRFRLYMSDSELLDHFKVCDGAKELWSSTGGGTRPVQDSIPLVPLGNIPYLSYFYASVDGI